VSTWIAWIVLARQHLLPGNWLNAFGGGDRLLDWLTASIGSATVLLTIFIVALWCRFLQDVAEAFDQAKLAHNGFFKWWFCILSSGAVLAPILEMFAPFRGALHPLLTMIALPSMINVPIAIAWGAALAIDTRNMLHKALRSP
jgi:hypothetical protein